MRAISSSAMFLRFFAIFLVIVLVPGVVFGVMCPWDIGVCAEIETFAYSGYGRICARGKI